MTDKMTEEIKLPQDCKNFDGKTNYCKKINHTIENGYADDFHCSNCKDFEERDKEK